MSAVLPTRARPGTPEFERNEAEQFRDAALCLGSSHAVC